MRTRLTSTEQPGNVTRMFYLVGSSVLFCLSGGRGTCGHLIVHGFDVPARTFGTHKVHLAKFYLVLVRLRSEATPSNDRDLQSDADGGQSLPLGLPGPVPYGETLFGLSCRRTTHSSEMRRIATTDVVGR